MNLFYLRIILFLCVLLLNFKTAQAIEDLPAIGMMSNSSNGLPSNKLSPSSSSSCPTNTSYKVKPNEQTYLTGWTEYYPSTCKQGPIGSWTVNTQPQYGSVSTGTTTGKIYCNVCPNNTFSFAGIYYTWTSSDANATNDSFTATWNSGSPDYLTQQVTFDISLIVSECTNEEDNIDALVAEYKGKKYANHPKAVDFTKKSSSRSRYFAFNELNKGDYNCALIDKSLTKKAIDYGLDLWIDKTKAINPNFGFNINSAYRNPVHNISVGGKDNSRHIYGDAVDLNNDSQSLDEYNKRYRAAKQAHADWLEDFEGKTGPCKAECVHADWRNHNKRFPKIKP